MHIWSSVILTQVYIMIDVYWNLSVARDLNFLVFGIKVHPIGMLVAKVETLWKSFYIYL